jgi:hypothetical protein
MYLKAGCVRSLVRHSRWWKVGVESKCHFNIGNSEAVALFRQMLARKWGHASARDGRLVFLIDRLGDFVVAPSSAG